MRDYRPELFIEEDAEALARRAAAIFIATLEKKQNPLALLPTGKTPLGLYQILAGSYGHRRDLWDNLRVIALDEYAGLPPDDPRLLCRWLCRAALDPLQIPQENRILFDSMAADEAARIEDWLAQNGPPDFAVLGLGANGHVAFNEPGSPLESRTRIVQLSRETMGANAAYWANLPAPEKAITLGIGNLRESRRTLLLVSGAHKADILARVLNGPVTPALPATYLRNMTGVTIIADRAAFHVLSE